MKVIICLIIAVIFSWFFAILPTFEKRPVGICENPAETCPGQREEVKMEFKTLKEIINN